MTIKRFPDIAFQEEDKNPAIGLFGRRFYKDQTPIEYLVEFLLVFDSRKTIGETTKGWKQAFPNSEDLKGWPINEPLKYYPKARLVLKLFSFLGSSNLETRHDCHRDHFKNITEALASRLQVQTSALQNDDILSFIEEMLIGFVGVSQNRTWCTHVFLPISRNFLASEAIWKKTKAKDLHNLTWEDSLSRGCYTFSNHDFLARGGELLFLQLCNLFDRATSSEILELEKRLNHKSGTGATLQNSIEVGLKTYLNSVPALNKLTEWIESIDPKTEEEIAARRHEAKCGWCPEESWREGYLFAYELNNLCSAAIDPLEKCELLKLSCVLQVLRSLCAQAARHWPVLAVDDAGINGVLGYCWLLTDPLEKDSAIKELSRRNLTRVQEMIHGAIRESSSDIQEDNYKKADEQAQQLFLKLGKAIGLIVPQKGPGARFVVNENLLRFFVLALIPPGERVTLKRFQSMLFDHFGIAFCSEQLAEAVRWTQPHKNKGTWAIREDGLESNLSAAGCLIHLSDALSLVQNPFGKSS